MKNLLLSLTALLVTLTEQFKATTDANLKNLYDELIDSYNTLQFALTQSINKGDSEEKTETKIAGIRKMIGTLEAKILDATSGQLPNRLKTIIELNTKEILGDVLIGDGLRISISFLADGSIEVGKVGKVGTSTSSGGTRGTSEGKDSFSINGGDFTNGNEAYKKLVSLFNGAEAFKQGTGISMRDGSSSFSAPEQLRVIKGKDIFKGIEIKKVEATPTAEVTPTATPSAPTQSTPVANATPTAPATTSAPKATPTDKPSAK